MIVILYFIIVLLLFLNLKLYSIEQFDVRYDNLDLIPKIFLNEAKKLNINYEVININPSKIKLFNGKKSVIITPMSYTFNDNKAVKLARNKFKTYNLLKKNNIPIPNFQLFQNINVKTKNQVLTKKYVNYPLVAKIIDGANGENVYINIENNSELSYSVDRIINNGYSDLMIEDFIKGSDHRILVFNNKVIDIIKRNPPFVIGDNDRNLKELIDIKNNERRHFGHRQINIDYYYLKKCNFNLQYIPNKNEKVIVNPLSNFHKGADLERVHISKIHSDNIKLFEKISKIMKLNILGIDFLTDDISISYKKTGKVNEINGIPNLDLHYYANNSNNTQVHSNIIESFFKN